ncbi:MAG: TraR/DksA C4-type zinc finger protein [Bacteroidota bacterium]
MKGKELQRVKAALLSELDVTLQKCCHQRLKDIVNDLQIRYANIKPDSSPDEVISVLLQSGVLKTISTASMIRLQESFERIRMGTFGLCVLCGREISAKYLEQNPTTKDCSSCDRESQRLMRPSGS